MKLRHRPLLVPTLIASVLFATSCGFGAHEPATDEADRPHTGDTGGRKPVPTIRLLTKTAANDPTRFEMARMIVEAWRGAGIPAELLPLDDAQINSRTFLGKDYDVALVSYGPTPERLDPENLLSRFASRNATSDGNNLSLFKNNKYDELYQAQNQAADADSRRKAVLDAQRIVYDELPAVPLLYPKVGAAYRSDRWDGIKPALGYPVFNIWNTTQATPKDGRDVLVVGTTFDPPTLNPVVAETLESQIPISLLYDTALAVGPDGKTVQRAADDVQVQGATVTVKLRDGLTFSDGKPVTADDFAFSAAYLRDHGAPLYSAGLKNVKSATANGLTATLTLAGPAAHFADVTLTQMPILPRHVWASIADPAKAANASPIGSGPFVLKQRRLGSSLSFVANRNHYDPPKVARLELTILGTFDAGVGALKSGEIDLYDDVQPALQYESLRNTPGVTVVETQSHGWRGLHFNTSREPGNDKYFRQALASLVPYEDLIDVVLKGGADRGGSVIAPVLGQWHDSSLKPFEEDRDKAMNALREAGYAFGPDGKLYFPAADADKRKLSCSRQDC
ncbi:peptide/nickel transport system substrate-binding protein [Kribbella orskensis]|uniref:Peptide/nickel transport system substrate-binding protein n=1 Tax=Kribbella orskensis TaxID=2512216 RepID=A0ABY2BLL5_9ACTN|nr:MULTISPECIES: ABC transporter substrate-binding protein [Kribbella]TCN40757.1 peptide/nickel transport system substrate-binding protein [Kribbella sp. VKM Ac-2500]TCO24009.1 peptide/nickel transport system substrate-binding protein [Kribbella orskensis]